MIYYNTIYQSEFSSIGTNRDFKFEILKKNYDGPFYSLTAAARPVIHAWDTDNPIAPVKGSSLNFTYINEGSNPLSSFYSADDQMYKGRFWLGNKVLFEGFLIQDDSSEFLIDTLHEVVLSFNDGLGLLKDIALNLAFAPGYNNLQTITEEIFEFKTLLDIIKHCLYCTGLELNTNLYENLKENDQIGTEIFPELTTINNETFFNGTDWDDCYTVLEKILGWYHLCLFQSNGAWNIVRWHEARYYLGAIPGYQYDKAMVLQGAITLNDTLSFGAPFPSVSPGNTQNPINIQNRILRPFKFSKYTFNYKKPVNFKNADFTILGDLLYEYTVGTGVNLQTIYEYEAPFWTVYGFLSQTVFIRRVVNYVGFEIERYIVVKGFSANPYTAAVSSQIEVSQNDKVKVSFQCRAFTPFTNTYFGLSVKNTAPSTFRLFAYGVEGAPSGNGPAAPWQSAASWNRQYTPSGEWFTNTIEPTAIPADGILEFFLASMTSGTTPGQETHYQGIQLEYEQLINDNITITGHYHKDEQTEVIKNNEDAEIYIDDSPKNSILGTTMNYGQDIGLLHKRTFLWHRGHISPTVEAVKVGQIISNETEFWRLNPRTILEGTINGISTPTNHVSMLTRWTYDQMPGLNFLAGKLSIDYRNNEITGTFWEMYKDNEQYIDLAGVYNFQYLYKKQ